VNRDTIVFSSCSFLLGLIIGSLLIGPKLATFRGAPAPPPAIAPQNATPMDAVRQQIATLNAALARDPRNFEALVQLGNMYMDAAKFPQAAGYYERALAVRDDSNVRVDLGICYKQTGQPEKALDAFRKAPDHWQAIFNEALVLGEMRRFDEAGAVLAKLERMRPGDPDVARLRQALAARVR
jgi:tetratricopeptide (TPR) repeat protein